MSTNTLTFGNTLLAQTGKKGALVPMDNTGYYLMNAGMLNAPLRLGHRYVVVLRVAKFMRNWGTLNLSILKRLMV